MTLLEQIVQLLSASPGNVIYHLITLFSLQVIFALSFTQWRRNPADHLMRRTLWASGAIFIGRLGLMLAGMAVSSNGATAVSVLPPLEQAINTATAVLITWALIPQPDEQPHLSDTIITILLLIIGVMYIFFAQTWPDMALSAIPYSATTQATIWAVLQLLTLVIGVILSFTQRNLWFSLRQNILLILLAVYIIHLLLNPNTISTQTDIAYWIRLGYLIAFPLWAVFVYRYSIDKLLTNIPSPVASESNLSEFITLSTKVVSSLQSQENVDNAIVMVNKLLPANHIALALNPEASKSHLYVTSKQQLAGTNDPKSWQINLDEWPAFRQALMENLTIELTPDGIGARQLRLWYEEMGIEPQGALLIEPMYAEKTAVGLLLLGAKATETAWSDSNKATATALAAYFGQVIHNSNAFTHAADQIAITPTPTTDESSQISGRIITLEDERDQLQSELGIAQARLLQAESQAAKASKQSRDLAATLEELDQVNQDERIGLLETEIETLRESLIEAEEAMALAVADEKGLSTEWIMTALTRYSSQLEEAQARIQLLETDLMHRERGVTDELVISLAQELRTPMTSIAGYTDLLLSEMLGTLGEKQRDFLQRVKANVERMDTYLGLIVQLTTSGDIVGDANMEPVDVQTVLETAVSTIITQIREKNLHLDMKIEPDMPQLAINRDAFQQILSNLLSNACQVSLQNSRVAISAAINKLPDSSHNEQNSNNGHNGHEKTIKFMHLAVTDSGGGINIDDRARVFDPQFQADHPLIGGLGDTGAGLAVARTLTEANGGRVWIDSNMGAGSTLSVLFPITPDIPTETEAEIHTNGTPS